MAAGVEVPALRRRDNWRLILAALIPMAACGLQLFFWTVFQPLAWFLFYPAVFLSSWVGGRRGGVLATVLSTGLGWYFFIPPEFSFAVQRPMAFVSIAMFTGMGLLFSLFHGQLREANQRATEALAAVRSAKQQLETQVLQRTADLEQSIAALRESEQRNRILVAEDIAERKRAEEALQKQNRFIQTILDNAPIGFALNTINDGAFQYVNTHFEEIYGVPHGALRSVENFFELVYPEPGYREELRARIMADIASGDPARMYWEDVSFTTRTGESKVVTAVNIPLPDQNLMVSTVMDVTHRKRAETALRESEERLRFALQRSHTGGWDLDLVDHTAHRTLEHDRIFGYPSLLPQWTYEMFLEHVIPEDRVEVDRLFREAVAAQTDWGFECRIRRADAEVRWIWAAGGHQRDGQGKARRMAGIVQDITERKRAEEALRVLNAELEQRVRERTAQLAGANQQLEAANQELEAFSYSVSHDLRAPLRHVLGYVEMLAQETGDQLTEKGQRYLDVITDASKEMGELIDDLLSFSRMARVEMRESSVELDPLVQKTLRDLETTTAGRNMVWKIPPLPVVQGDPAMLKQVLANLLGNAVKYTRPRDPAQIEIGCAGAEDGRIILFVRDNGVGFEPQYAHKLFGVFQRLHRADEFEGAGVGLANVRRIIARHGGRTWAEGKVNEGAMFYFTLKPSADSAK
jgi:PAS domain S-box-containing protein